MSQTFHCWKRKTKNKSRTYDSDKNICLACLDTLFDITRTVAAHDAITVQRADMFAQSRKTCTRPAPTLLASYASTGRALFKNASLEETHAQQPTNTTQSTSSNPTSSTHLPLLRWYRAMRSGRVGFSALYPTFTYLSSPFKETK